MCGAELSVSVGEQGMRGRAGSGEDGGRDGCGVQG